MARAATARACLFALSLVAAAALSDGAGATAPAPAADCTDALLSLAGCLSYVQEGSTVTTPDPTCCSGLKDVVRKEVACLCQAFQGGQDFGIALNMTKALQLPAACNVKTPPFSKCNISVPGGVPAPAPAPAPASGAPFFGQPSSSAPAPASGAPFFGQPSSSAPAPASGAPFFGQSPSSATPSVSPAGTGSDLPTAAPASAPSPSHSDAVSFPVPARTIAAAAVAATLLAYRIL